MVSSFLKTLLIVLTFRQIVINCQNTSDFCNEFKILKESKGNPPLKWLSLIPTAKDRYLHLNSPSGQWVYKFDCNCNYGDKCPNIGHGITLTQFTDNKLKTLFWRRYPFIHNGITYLYGDPVDNDPQKDGIKMYANGTTDWIYKTNEWLDKSIKSYAICYLWKTDKTKDPGLIPPNTTINKPSEVMTKNVLSIFVPPFDAELPIGSVPQYGFSFDKTQVNDITVELTGNYPKVDIVYKKRPVLYSFSDYIVPCQHSQYMLLPNGDAITFAEIDNTKYDVFYFRSEPTNFLTISSLNLMVFFGCEDKQKPSKSLKDYKSDNIYSYFNKD